MLVVGESLEGRETIGVKLGAVSIIVHIPLLSECIKVSLRINIQFVCFCTMLLQDVEFVKTEQFLVLG